MDNSLNKRRIARTRRVFRNRKKTQGNQEKPRMSVSKTLNHIFVQLIDDEKGLTLASIGTMAKENKKLNKSKKEIAKEIGRQIAGIAKEKNISEVIFDRGRFKFHGIVKELAESAREAGLKF